MKVKNKVLTTVLMFISLVPFAQNNEHKYYRKIGGISEQWQKIELPNDLFSTATANLSDLKLIGSNQHNDTLEVPYLRHLSEGKNDAGTIDFIALNNSFNEKGYYYTFEIPNSRLLNKLH